MKYYLSEYWAMMQSRETRDEALNKWYAASEEYYKYFDTIKDKLPKNFINLYNKNDGFHDSIIKKISIENMRLKSCEVKFTLRINEVDYILAYKNVIGFEVDIPPEENGLFGWGYDELELLDNGYFEHRILCDINSEFKITFKKLSIKKVTGEANV
ncbi:MAG: DUF4085 domain-containing protein [Oscillospiraceae bacterium]|nr:DUF4085 domain-containing protein [Oscillospiraceae bacterium]